VEGFTQQQSAAVAGGALAIKLNADGPLQDGIQGDRLSPMADGPLESGSCRNVLISQENTIRHLCFQAFLMNKAGLYNVATPRQLHCPQ
ncbi:hypothetical protein, partial [Halomonas sp. BC04]|uniref:hypothetical protein n=1 Tax=Halomonas sp. BC04 TaxID=1403540 RepID=UPI0005BA4AA8